MINFDSEKELEDAICRSLDKGTNPIDGSRVTSYKRQVWLGEYGKVDIIAFCKDDDENNGNPTQLTVIELKNTPLKHDHASQIARYKGFFDNSPVYSESNIEDITYQLVGLKTFPSSSDLCYLLQSMDWLEVYEIHADFENGITIDQMGGWHPTKSKDTDFAEFIGNSDVLTMKKPKTKGNF